MNEIRIPQNKYFNSDFKNCIGQFFGKSISQNKFYETNFYYLFNFPRISESEGKIDIKINEDIANFNWNKEFIKEILNRKNQSFSKLDVYGFQVESFTFLCSWRLVVGLGASHPQETSMTLHHIYGIPYVPGSAVKGVTRHWAVLKFTDENQDFIITQIKEKESLSNPDFYDAIQKVSKALDNGNELNIKVNDITFKDLIEIFGTQKQRGKVIFFDAYPIENINLKIDIMNPHYPKYYGGEAPPTDWQNPVPIKFLTVENTKFKFYLTGKEEKLLNIAKTLLIDALKNYGVGAKTSLGYGLFKEI